MGCTHIANCPLFPYLNASLAGWRNVYCDSSVGWKDCARFKLSGTGQPVPLALLPNGQLPVSMLPNVGRAQSVELIGRLDPVKTEPTCTAPGPALPPPPPNGLRAPRGGSFTLDWRRPVRARRWTRIVQWLRAPA